MVGVLIPDISDELSKKNVPTEEQGESAGSIGVSAGEYESVPDAVVVSLSTLSANLAATC